MENQTNEGVEKIMAIRCNYHQFNDKEFYYTCDDCMSEDVIEPEEINDLPLGEPIKYDLVYIDGIGYCEKPF